MTAKFNCITQFLDGKDATPDTLALFDQHHIGGLNTTRILFEQIDIKQNTHILDIGSGWGGPARYAASHYNCHVTGIDIDKDNVKTAKDLSSASKMDKNTLFLCIDALKYNAIAPFDAAYMLHTSMCIADKQKLIQNINNHLARDGIIGIFDIFKMDGAPPLAYPTPWSETAANSHLQTAQSMIDLLIQEGFKILYHNDMHEYALEKVSKAISFLQSSEAATNATKLHLGENYLQKMENLKAGLLAKTCAPHMIIARKLKR